MADQDRRRAIDEALKLYAQKAREGMDFTDGPCLSEEVIPDWCVDIAHSPRQRSDNWPRNQCQSYRRGKVHHFVELDKYGNLIRAE